MPTWIMMPQSSVPVRMKISSSSFGIAFERWIGEIGDVGSDQSGEDTDRGAAIRSGTVIGRDIPTEQGGDQHDAAMREIEHPTDAEHQREPDGAEAVQRTDGETVDQDLQGEHWMFRWSGRWSGRGSGRWSGRGSDCALAPSSRVTPICRVTLVCRVTVGLARPAISRSV